jgi:hypothetical protein
MTAIHRREMLRVVLSGAAVATAAFVMLPVAAEAAPLTMNKNLEAPTENLAEEAVVVIRPRRRRVCWWRRGRRVCTWR